MSTLVEHREGGQTADESRAGEVSASEMGGRCFFVFGPRDGRWRLGWLLLAGMVLLGSGCDAMPTDPEGTLAKIRASSLSVGLSVRRPWTGSTHQYVDGVECRLLRQWAEENEVPIEWRVLTESELVKGLGQGEIHVAVAGFTDDTPWSKDVAMTQPYYENDEGRHVMLVPRGENRWLLELDRFLARQRPRIETMLREESAR